MIDSLFLYNFPTTVEHPGHQMEGVFQLKTCQRKLVLAPRAYQLSAGLQHEQYQGTAAYHFLLEMICGLKSQLVGENEIVAQVKQAYKQYLSSSPRHPFLIRVLEKLFQDAKKIRTTHLLGMTQKTYGALARKAVFAHGQVQQVLILGSGNLANDLIHQFKKKAQITLSARNQLRLQELASQHDISLLNWKNYHDYLKFPYIINTIGADRKLFGDDFFATWEQQNSHQRLFVDLAHPSPIRVTPERFSSLLFLEDIFKAGAIHEREKQSKLQDAKEAIKELTNRRESYWYQYAYKQRASSAHVS